MNLNVFLPAALVASLLSLSGCVQPAARATGPVVPVVSGGPLPAQAAMKPLPVTMLFSPIEPPAEKSEYRGDPPLVGQVWINGYWYWQVNQYAWIPGHWETPPQIGLRWSPHVWMPVQGGWGLMGGRWER